MDNANNITAVKVYFGQMIDYLRNAMIRKATAADFDFIYRLYMHPAINPYLLYEVMDKEAFAPIFSELLDKDILYIFSNSGNDIGMFKLIPQPHRNSHTAYLGGVAVDPAYSGMGYGKQMMQAIIALGQAKNFLRIELTVSVLNKRAITLYEKTGFVKEGVLRKFTWLKSENRFIDEAMMSYLY